MFSSRVAIANILFLTFTMGLGLVHIVQPNVQNNMYNIYPIQLDHNNTLSNSLQTNYQFNITLLSNSKNQLVFY
jgi:hypothetical protein